MHKDLRKNTKLLIISDTGMYRNDLELVAFGPVVLEIQYLLTHYDSITWLGYERLDQLNNKSYRSIKNKKLVPVLIPRIGGVTVLSKLKIIALYPAMFFKIMRLIVNHRYIHVRAPSHPAIIAMFLSLFFKRKQFWFKYAGTWIDKASRYYELQRYILKRLRGNSKVTVNGHWETNNINILAFENPCLEVDDRIDGMKCLKVKNLANKINFCFVGALNEFKGVNLILEAFSLLEDTSKIGKIHFVGDGGERSLYENLGSEIDLEIVFHGFLPRVKIVDIYKNSHFILLPSKSEGFPKVIGEGMNYGCVPIVSDVSCISQYIVDGKNGYLIEPNTLPKLIRTIERCFELSKESYKRMIIENYELASLFTYSYYLNKIKNKIFH